MLIWMCALRCEAKPVIDFFRLKKSNQHKTYDTYLNEQNICIVSGIGSQNMASAVNWSQKQFPQSDIGWINIGIAGHKSLDTGKVITAESVTSESEDGIFVLPEVIDNPFQSMPVRSRCKACFDYAEDTAFDMEAYAFIDSTTHYSNINRCSVIKVISDNQWVPATRNKAKISQLIEQNMPAIGQIAQNLLI